MPGRSLLTVSLALLLSSGGHAAGQAPEQPRVTITSATPSAPLKAPRKAAAPTVMARRAFDVQSWFGRTEPPADLSTGSRGLVILARELTLENRRYTLDTPQLVMVVDRLRVGPNTVIDVSGRRVRAAGGEVVIIARQITCESGGGLQLVSRGGPRRGEGGSIILSAGRVDGAVSAARFRPAEAMRRPARDVAIAPGRPQGTPRPQQPVRPSAPIALAPCISAAVDGGPGGVVTVRDHRPGRRPETTRQTPPGRPGRALSKPLRAAIQDDTFVQTAWSMWALEWVEGLQLEIYQASQVGDHPRLLALLREYAAFDGPVELVTSDMRAQYAGVLGELNEYRRTALPALSVEEVTVQPAALPQTLTVFTEGATLRAFLAPTHALAAQTSIGGRSVLGLIEYQPERSDELAIEVEWELTVDPWAERLAAEHLEKKGQPLDGVFTGWSLDAKPLQELGVRSALATLLPGGRRLRVRFVVDAARANLVFWRLLNSTGLAWTVDWSFREASTSRVVTGTWAGPPLSLIRQRESAVTLRDGALVNDGSSPVTVSYLRNEDGSFVALDPAVRLNAGETIALPEAVNAAAPRSIPPEAVETAFDPERFASDFHVLNAEEVVDRLVIRNNLPTSDPLRGAFDRLRITVTAAIDGDSTTEPSAMGPFELSATGTRGGQISLPVLRLARGARRVTVQGTAYYAHGERTLAPTTFDTLTIAITDDMFRD